MSSTGHHMFKSCPLEHYAKTKINNQKGDVGKTTTFNQSAGILHLVKCDLSLKDNVESVLVPLDMFKSCPLELPS
jgi:hypothetical protein